MAYKYCKVISILKLITNYRIIRNNSKNIKNIM